MKNARYMQVIDKFGRVKSGSDKKGEVNEGAWALHLDEDEED